MSLAVVINTTDKYSHIWDTWYHYYKKHWHLDFPVYFLNEKKDIPYPFKQIKVDIPERDQWTKKLRESVEQIPEDNLFILLEDLLFTDGFEKGEFEFIYKFFRSHDVDSLRILKHSSATKQHATLYSQMWKLDKNSNYLISHQPGIWKKKFLLECIALDEDPWTNEIHGTQRIQGKGFDIYQYEKQWFVNVLRHGKVVEQHKHLLNYN